jgi:hypothetical protein
MSDLTPSDPTTPRNKTELQQHDDSVLLETSLPRALKTAMQVYRLEEQFERAHAAAREVSRIIELDGGRFVALQRAKTREERFNIHCEAHAALEDFPGKDVLVSVRESVRLAIRTKPPGRDRSWLIGKMLDVLRINPDTTTEYVQALAWKLAECPKQPTEYYFSRRKDWMPMPAIAATVNHVIETYKPEYGRPPDIPDLLSECGRHCNRLIRLHDDINELGSTWVRLTQVVQATEDSYPDDEDWD